MKPQIEWLVNIGTRPPSCSPRPMIGLHKLSRHAWVAGLAGIVLSFSLGASSYAQGQEPLPEQIAAYIDAHNRAASFSTPQERLQLMEYDTPEEVRESTRSRRLADVFAHLQTVGAMVQRVDPGMPMGDESPRKKVVSAELLEVEHVSMGETGERIVEVLAYRLDREANLHLISAYEEQRDVPLPENVAVQVRPKIQYWIQVDGLWKKQETELYFLDR